MQSTRQNTFYLLPLRFFHKLLKMSAVSHDKDVGAPSLSHTVVSY